ncbi:MAG: T9SS type A sorting domain-containing protein [Haliscomenobacter sp.]|nr:T9SS type A sorting domain-containing protein [Haliscomenobacter sp.]
MTIPDRMLGPGEEVLVPVYLGAPDRIKGLQFTLQADPHFVEISGIEFGLADQNHILWTEGNSETLNLSWDAGYSNILDLPGGSVPPLLTLKLRAVQAAPLSRALRLDQRGISPEAYLENLSGYETKPLALDYHSALVDRLVLLPPVPNPAGAFTTVQWTLPREGEAYLELRDSWGRVCAQLQERFYAGTHTWTIERSQVPGPGLYILTVRAMGQWQSQKVLFIE